MNEEININDINQILEEFINLSQEEIKRRLEKWPTDLSQQAAHEVIGALLARQVTLACQLAACPPIWNGHIAPLILRAMSDVFITLAWVLKDPLKRCEKFIHYGLGQAKLQLEHRRAEMKTRETDENEEEYCEAFESWINSQRATFLTEVNLGSWSGITTRSMAEESGHIDFYNYVYSPFSACAHSTWHHLALYNLQECQNPLHRLHRVATINNSHLDPHYMYLAAKYLRKTFREFDNSFNIEVSALSAFDILNERMSNFGDSQDPSPK